MITPNEWVNKTIFQLYTNEELIKIISDIQKDALRELRECVNKIRPQLLLTDDNAWTLRYLLDEYDSIDYLND